MFFNSIKEINSLRKEINRLLSEGMPNIYSKIALEKIWGSQIDFVGLKHLSSGQSRGAPTHDDIIEY